MTARHLLDTPAAYASTHRAIIARCEQVLIESCNAELRLAQQFCHLAELRVQKHHLERAQWLIESAEKAVAMAGKYCNDPEQRKKELSRLSQRIGHVYLQIKRLSA